MNIAIRTGAVATAAVLSLALAACTPANEKPAPQNSAPNSAPTQSEAPAPEATPLSGNLVAAGASAQEKAIEAWVATYNEVQPGVTVTYDPVGSGGGRTQFLQGASSFAGSDSSLKPEEYEAAIERCGELGAINLPVYVSPIAVIFNLDGIEHVNMTAEVIAKVFNAKITKWNDPEIVALNSDITLPDLPITIVHRADTSGTTDNFTDYLAKVAGDAWGHEKSDKWLGATGESGQGTSAVVQIVESTEGAIGYADASRAGSLGTVALGVGDAFVPFSAEAAAAAVDASPRKEGNGANDIAISIDRNTTAAGAYPLVLISYHIVCQQYEDKNERDMVTSFIKYAASQEGQKVAQAAAGSSPISPALSAEIVKILDEIAAR